MAMRNLFLLGGTALLLGGGFTALWSFMGSSKDVTSGAAPQILASLQGFEPDTPISYSISTPQGIDIKGQGLTNAAGEIQLPPYEKNNLNQEPLTYDITLNHTEPEKDPLHIVLTLDPAAHSLSILGRGLGEFSKATLQTGLESQDIKTDWVGNFVDHQNFTLKDLEKSEGVKFAFYNYGFAQDVYNPNPQIIKIFAAPGGGGLDDTDVNTYDTPSDCGSPQISSCNTGALDAQFDNFVSNFVEAAQEAAAQISLVTMQYTQIIGTFFDAKQQLEVQRGIQKLTAEAHKDYHPSDMMCQFGTFVRSLPRAEEKSRLEKQAMNSALMNFYRASEHASSSEGFGMDIKNRIAQFRQTYCDPADADNGLDYMCEHDQDQDFTNSALGAAAPGGIGATDKMRMNKDISYTRTAGNPLTLELDFTDGTLTSDEEDILALAKNLYWPMALEVAPADTVIDKHKTYMVSRSLMAITNVAHNSFTHMASLKSQADNNLGADSGWNFMKALIRDFGLSDAETHELLGDFPSYYAQMEVLTKKIYQSPDFYTNLLDKPANLDRISVSLDAIKLMQARDHYETSLRQEMLTSLLVENALMDYVDRVNVSVLESWVQK